MKEKSCRQNVKERRFRYKVIEWGDRMDGTVVDGYSVLFLFLPLSRTFVNANLPYQSLLAMQSTNKK